MNSAGAPAGIGCIAQYPHSAQKGWKVCQHDGLGGVLRMVVEMEGVLLDGDAVGAVADTATTVSTNAR